MLCPKEKVLGKDQFSRKELGLLERTLHYAKKSTCRQRHAALVFKSGKVLSIATNKYYNDPHMFPKDTMNNTYDMIGVHAEVAALKVLPEHHVKGSTVYVARINNFGQPRFSRPCANCEKYLREHGVRKVIYTDTMEAFDMAA